MLEYVFIASVALVAVALAGIIVGRHFVFTILGIELILVASATMLVAFFSFANSSNPEVVTMLVGIWAVAAAEAIGMMTLYICMKSYGMDFDTSKLSRLKW